MGQDIQLSKDNCLRPDQGTAALKHLLAKRAEAAHCSRAFAGGKSVSELQDTVKNWKQSSAEDEGFKEILQATATVGELKVDDEAGFPFRLSY